MGTIKTGDVKKKAIAGHVEKIMELLGIDLKDPNFQDTPMRVAKMYYDELFSSLHQPFPVITDFPAGDTGSNIVLEKNISFTSTCGHHWMPIIGYCHVAYIPTGGKVLGLSKFHRIVKYHAALPQIQERLVQMIADSLIQYTGTEDVAVIMKAEHHCIKCRGVRDQSSETVNSFVGGAFKKEATRMELYQMLQI